jgi:glutamate synthase domain-containing protein 2
MAIDVIIAGDVVDVHDVACLVTIGTSAVHPYLAMATAGPEREAAYRKALEAGLLKVMAKMGISCAASYRGGLVLEALGLGSEVMRTCFPSMPSRIGGADLADLDALARSRMAEATAPPDHGRVRFRKAGEHHAYNPPGVRTAQKAAAMRTATCSASGFTSHMDRPQCCASCSCCASDSPTPLDEVEPASEIVKRFVSTAMSLGALSPEAHEALALAMNQIGARSNSGEGGEDPDTYEHAAIRRDNRVKQVASARFGVTPAYLAALMSSRSIAQGLKPGEGGQPPGSKVTSPPSAAPRAARCTIRRRRTTTSTPSRTCAAYLRPETVNPRAWPASLVAESGVARSPPAGKAHADHVLSRGTTAARAPHRSSIKNVPWELGLAETQQVLVANRLRERVSLRTDGGLRSGRDIVVAALLGAEEFGFGTGVLVALGCDMARQCHLNTCPTGIATQREDLRAKFTGRPEHVINHLFLIAEDVREELARLGARTVDEIVGRADSGGAERLRPGPVAGARACERRRAHAARGDATVRSRGCSRVRSHRQLAADRRRAARSWRIPCLRAAPARASARYRRGRRAVPRRRGAGLRGQGHGR